MAHQWTPETREEVARRVAAGDPYSKIARELRVSRGSIKHHFGPAPVEESARDQFSTYKEIHAPRPSPGRLRVRVKAHAPDTPPQGEQYRILGIGDLHDKPGRDKRHCSWIGRHAAATAPDQIVSIGDFLSLDSLSMHEKPGSATDATRPSFPQELESGEEALSLIDREVPEIRKHLVYGNHDGDRPARWANADPHRCGDFPLRVEQVFARYRWTTTPFEGFYFVGGVGFCHVPLNDIGKTYGGKHSENTIANDATFSLVWGHDHRFRFKNFRKIGPNNKISLCNLGTAMPYGTVEHYSKGTTGWSYGCVDMTIQGGVIVSHRFISMIELEEMYGD